MSRNPTNFKIQFRIPQLFCQKTNVSAVSGTPLGLFFCFPCFFCFHFFSCCPCFSFFFPFFFLYSGTEKTVKLGRKPFITLKQWTIWKKNAFGRKVPATGARGGRWRGEEGGRERREEGGGERRGRGGEVGGVGKRRWVGREEVCVCVCVCACLCVSVCACLCVCVSVCLCLLPGGKGTARRRRTHALKACLTSSGRALVFLCFVVSKGGTFSHTFDQPMAASALRRTAKSTPDGVSNPSWPSNPVGDPRSLAPMFDPEHAHSLPQDQTAPAGIQPQPVTSLLDQPIEGSVQYQHAGNDQTPLTTETSPQHQAPGTCTAAATPAQYLQAGEGSISNPIVDAQLTHPLSRHDGAEMLAFPLMHDVATQRRRAGGRCRKWAVSKQAKVRILHHLRLAVCTW